MTKEKILAINVLYYPLVGGGAEITIKNLYEGLAEREYEINVLTFTDNKQVYEEINRVKVFREKIPNLYLPLFINKKKPSILIRRLWHLIDVYNPLSRKLVENYIDKIKPDIIISHNIPGFSPSIWSAAYSKGIPLVQVLHDLYLLCPTNMFKENRICKERCIKCSLARLPHKILSNKVSAVVGISKFILNKALTYGYFLNTPIKTVIYNSRNIKISETKPRKFDGNVHFGFIGNIAPNKGLEVLLKAYMKIKNRNTRLYIAGSGEIKYVNYLKSKYKDNSIIWLGWIKPGEFFQIVDFTVVPSIWYEALGMVVVESLAYGIPVIASNIGGIPEMVEENVNGLLFEPGNDEDLANKLVLVSEKITFWKEKAEIIKKRAKKFIDFDSWLDKWEELVSKCIK